MKKLIKSVIIFAAATVICVACEKPENPNSKDDITPEEQAERQANLKALKYLTEDIMDSYYYWYNQMQSVEYNYKTDIYKYFDKILYRKDRWSWMIDGQEYIADESGVVSGSYGASFGQLHDPVDNKIILDYNVMVRYVYPNSPFEQAGIKRGWIINKIDGKSVKDYWLKDDDTLNQFNALLNNPSTTIAHSFEFIDSDDNVYTKQVVAAETINTRPCLVKKIFTAEDYPGLTAPVGYFHYLSFKADEDINGKSMLDDISEPMQYFKEHNVKTLIIDLRYNGGGDSRASDLLVSYIAPHSADGQVYVKRTHNNKMRSQDKEQVVNCAADSPGFEHLYFITGKGSASASEMSLNGLKPLADVTHVGGMTYGKPNGMYVFLYPSDRKSEAQYNNGDYSQLQYVFLPICFYNANGLGQNIPDEGMTPDNIRPDDLYHDFDATEDNIAACLYNIVNGSFPEVPERASIRTKAGRSSDNTPRMKLLNKEDYDQNYGSYFVKPDFL